MPLLRSLDQARRGQEIDELLKVQLPVAVVHHLQSLQRAFQRAESPNDRSKRALECLRHDPQALLRPLRSSVSPPRSQYLVGALEARHRTALDTKSSTSAAHQPLSHHYLSHAPRSFLRPQVPAILIKLVEKHLVAFELLAAVPHMPSKSI